MKMPFLFRAKIAQSAAKLFGFKTEQGYRFAPLNSHIEVLNFWPGQDAEQVWLYQFIKLRIGDLLSKEKTLLIASVFGPRNYIQQSPAVIKIFFSGENIQRFKTYRDYCLNEVDLSLGLEYVHADNYMRFPLWLFFLLPVDSNAANIKRIMDGIMKDIRADARTDKKFCAMICSHDRNGIRARLMEALSNIEPVTSAGKYLNNSNELKTVYDDNKQALLRDYKFNICPENTNVDGYVTEKIFDSVMAGSIPVYWGSNNNPEPEILNHEAILFYNNKSSTTNLLNRIEELHTTHKLYQEFAMQDRFQPHAAEYIAEMLHELEMKIRKMIQK